MAALPVINGPSTTALFRPRRIPTKILPAPGIYNARLTVMDNAGNTVKRAIAITVTQTLSAWKSVYFTPAELGDPNVSGDSADIDRDGLTTVEEYGFGLNPKLADSAALTDRRGVGRSPSNPHVSARQSRC